MKLLKLNCTTSKKRAESWTIDLKKKLAAACDSYVPYAIFFAVFVVIFATFLVVRGPHTSRPQLTHWSAVAVHTFLVRKLHVRRSASPHVTDALFLVHCGQLRSVVVSSFGSVVVIRHTESKLTPRSRNNGTHISGVVNGE